jgi:hypothetical protein
MVWILFIILIFDRWKLPLSRWAKDKESYFIPDRAQEVWAEKLIQVFYERGFIISSSGVSRCLHPAAAIFDAESIFITAMCTSEGDQFGSAAATASLIDDLDLLLMTKGAKSALDAVKLLFFVFEIIDIA